MFTDTEHRILLSAMGRELDICKQVDKEVYREPYEKSLESVCKSINKKIHNIQHKYQWHDLRKKPNDLPPCDDKMYLLELDTDNPIIRHVIWRGYMIKPNVDEYLHVLAWREIEPFEEVE